MASAWARIVKQRTGHKASFGYWDEVFEGNPNVANAGEPGVGLNHRPGNRPYILGQYKDAFIFNPSHRAIPGDVYLSEAEWDVARQVQEGYILVEPHVKGTVSGSNKDWGWDNWVRVANELPVYQLDYGKEILPDATPLPCSSFREACAYVGRAKLFVGTDGGLHHAAAALKTSAVVIWGHYSSPEILGYKSQRNIWHGSGPCGNLKPCEDCHRSMQLISPESVIDAVMREVVSA